MVARGGTTIGAGYFGGRFRIQSLASKGIARQNSRCSWTSGADYPGGRRFLCGWQKTPSIWRSAKLEWRVCIAASVLSTAARAGEFAIESDCAGDVWRREGRGASGTNMGIL